MKKILLICFVALSPYTLFAAYDLAIEGGYIAWSQANSATTTTGDAKTTVFGVAAHGKETIAGVVTIGFGPMMNVGSGKVSYPNSANINSYEHNLFRLGVEVLGQLEINSPVKPFVKLGVGRDFISARQTSFVSNNYYTLEGNYGSYFFNALLGIAFDFDKYWSVFVQGGLTIGGKGSTGITSNKVNNVNSSTTIVDQQISFTGFLITGGVSFSLGR